MSIQYVLGTRLDLEIFRPGHMHQEDPDLGGFKVVKTAYSIALFVDPWMPYPLSSGDIGYNLSPHILPLGSGEPS